MKLTITYDLDKEFDNLQRGLKTVFNPEHQSKLVREMMAAKVNLSSKEEVDKFIAQKIQDENINSQQAAHDIQKKWDKISQSAISRMDKLFATSAPFENITVYLSLNGRCAYNFPERYFFVCFTRPNPIGVMIHELLHFYTHLLIQPYFIEQGEEDKHGEFKEALTVLLNTEFNDVIEEQDKGYEKHAESRAWIESNWTKGMTVQELAKRYLER
ncbi:MAG TPA: hypothetical protein VGE59_04245 [Patescibacteria group bacterium]